MLYFDTSAVLPYYREEAHSAQIQALLSAQTEPVLISHLTEVEFASALARWVRMGELTERQANRVEAAWYEDVEEGRFLLQPIAPGHFERARHWLLSRKTVLRTLDALHLATAAAHEAELVSLDTAMIDAAEFLGLRVRSVI